ncbi:phosphoribosylglycinamide formyltransferase [Sciscionella marina]|uniref:phosphoribosylglycinamide formyltransferase n=1 Tax=Sciscionella marina TaxID=508770 RepID=UPI0003666EF4|nr:phosphoribosylglycinamide formyltransferase [Sciscionella marina]
MQTQLADGTIVLPPTARVVVLVSGSGTLLQALLDDPSLPVRVVAVGADRPGIEGLERARRAEVPTFVTRLRDHDGREGWDTALAEAVAAHEPDLIVSAGFMKILGSVFLDRFAPRVINTHPALLPAFPGAHAVREALDYGVRVTGSTVHLVDGGTDTGPILAQEPVPIAPGDDEQTLHDRIKAAERRLLVATVTRLVHEGCTIKGRRVEFP